MSLSSANCGLYLKVPQGTSLPSELHANIGCKVAGGKMIRYHKAVCQPLMNALFQGNRRS